MAVKLLRGADLFELFDPNLGDCIQAALVVLLEMIEGLVPNDVEKRVLPPENGKLSGPAGNPLGSSVCCVSKFNGFFSL